MKIIQFSVKPLVFLLFLLVLFSSAAKGVSPFEADKPTVHLGSMKSAGIDPEKLIKSKKCYQKDWQIPLILAAFLSASATALFSLKFRLET